MQSLFARALRFPVRNRAALLALITAALLFAVAPGARAQFGGPPTTKVHDPTAILGACSRLGLPVPKQGTATLFSGEVKGLIVQFPGWQYPAVIDAESGTIRYDNFEGHWGDKLQLNKFLQMYAVEKARIEASRRGHTVTEQQLSDGTIKLTVQIGGAA